MFHSVARAIQGAQLTRNISKANGLVTIVDPVPLGHTRYVAMSEEGSFEGPMGAQNPVTVAQSLLGTGDIEVLIQRPDGTLWGFDAGGIGLGVVRKIGDSNNATVLLAPGESLMARLAATADDAARVTVHSQFIDLQGPFEHQRVMMEDDFETIIPSPAFGKIHSPIGFAGSAMNVNSYLVRDGQAGGSIDDQVMENAVILDRSVGQIAMPLSCNAAIMQNAVGLYEDQFFGGVISLRENMRIEAAQAVPGGAPGVMAFTSYLVTDDPNA
jgi:hypothetical protein